MNSNKIVKVLTLIGFALLITSFVAYKSGKFNTIFGVKEEIKDMTSTPDSSLVINDTIRISPDILPTSKSIVIIDQKIKFKKDSLVLDSANNPTK